MAVGRHALTRDAVVSAARDLLVEVGLEAVSLRRVASRLGVTAPALYAYVDDKEDLLRGIAEVEFSELITRFDAVDQTDPLERIAALGRTYIAYARERPERFRLIFRHAPELATGAPTGAELPLATKSFEVAAQATEDAMAAGAIREGDPLLTSLMLWTAAHGLAEVLLLGFELGEDAEEALITEVLSAMIRGLSA